MNGDPTQGNGTQMTGNVNDKRDKMTDDDLTVIAGTRDQLEGVLQRRNGSAKEQAVKVLEKFMKGLNPHDFSEGRRSCRHSSGGC